MKLVITYCTLLKFNELYFFLKTPHQLSFLKNKIHTRASPTFSTSLTKLFLSTTWIKIIYWQISLFSQTSNSKR